MKKLLPVILVIFFFLQSSFSYEWEPYGPPEIRANKLCFVNSNYAQAVACVDTGMFIITDYVGQIWEYYSNYNMQVTEVALLGLDSDSMLVILNEGSFSDGIWSFKFETGQFDVVSWCFKPNFIIAKFWENKFYVGYDDGLLFSENGINWNSVTFFNNKTCLDMEMSGDDFIVATTEEYNNTFFSDDSGITWTELEGENITELTRGNSSYNDIYGISKGESYNCGFFRVDILDKEWDDIFYSYQLNALGTDNTGTPFLGWYNTAPPHEGIARYKFYNPNSGLMFINEGLPDFNIISIASTSDYIGGNIIFCCTESGIYTCNDFAVGYNELSIECDVSIYPNPVSNHTHIKINSAQYFNEPVSIYILNNQGKKVDEIEVKGSSLNIKWNKGNLPSGVYYLVIKTGKEQISEKFIIL